MTKNKTEKHCVGCGSAASKKYRWMADDGWSYQVSVCWRCHDTPEQLEKIRKKVKI